MATALNISVPSIPDLHERVRERKIGIVTARWNPEITSSLTAAAKKTLAEAGIKEENILTYEVPGSFELPLGAQMLIEYGSADAVICIGCLIKGDTPHFHYISEAVSMHISQLAVRHNKPVSFGVLTVDTLQQAQDRAGGKLGNKGEEAALAALEMLSMKEKLKKGKSAGSIGFGSGK